MGIFSSITDSLFGDPNQGLNAQQKSNKQSQAYTKEQADLSVADANRLYGESRLPMEMGYQGAIDALGGATRQQIDTSARGNYYGQEALLAGMPQFQAAILGMPVDNSALKPKILHPERNLDWMWNTTVGTRTGGHDPFEGLIPADEVAAMEATGLSTRDIRNQYASNLAKEQERQRNSLDFTPGETTNSALARRAFEEGKITEREYRQLQQSFKADPSLASGTRWSSAGSYESLANRLPDSVSPAYRSTLENLFSAIYGGA